ncbi:MAG: polyphosphate glucokinase [Gammaproteobacteria bacterium]|nr:polyphosphate glucokinase [Gammaproteobacteria bacterium]
MRAKKKAPRRILVVDVGGSHVKLRIGQRGKTQKFVSGPKMSAADMVKGVRKLTSVAENDAFSIGYPGLVVRGRIAADPHNLGHGWLGFDFEEAFGKPVRVINDAAMQALGSYNGGRMLFLGLGTGLGATLVLDGIVEPMELGHMPYKHGRSYENYVGARGLRRLGLKKWRKVVRDIIDQLKTALEADYVVLGGGNAEWLKTLPRGVRLGDNSNAMTGGQLLWRESEAPVARSAKRRSRVAARKMPRKELAARPQD